jgi:hypothetical protein
VSHCRISKSGANDVHTREKYTLKTSPGQFWRNQYLRICPSLLHNRPRSLDLFLLSEELSRATQSIFSVTCKDQQKIEKSLTESRREVVDADNPSIQVYVGSNVCWHSTIYNNQLSHFGAFTSSWHSVFQATHDSLGWWWWCSWKVIDTISIIWCGLIGLENSCPHPTKLCTAQQTPTPVIHGLAYLLLLRGRKSQ